MPSQNFLSKTLYFLFAEDKKNAFSSVVAEASDVETLPCDEIIDLALDIPPPDAGVRGDKEEPARQSELALQLKATLVQALNHTMPHLIKYRRQGDNRLKPDAAAIRRVEKKLLAARSDSVPDTLLEPAHRLLDTLLSLQQSDDPVIHETVHHAFDLVHTLSDALEAIAAGEKIAHLEWEAQVTATADAYRNNMLAALPPHITQRHQALLSESNSASAEDQRFAQLKQSLMAENRLTRQRLAECLQQQAGAILSCARDARLYAMDILLTRADRTAVGSGEQLADWMQEYQVFGCSVPAAKEGGAQGHPLANRLQQENENDQLVRHLLHMANIAGGLAVRVKQVIEQITPDNKRKERDKRWHCAEGRARNLTQIAKRVSAMSAKEMPSHQPTYTEAVNRAVSDSALLLLDAIQQTERRIKQIPTAAERVAEAVEQYLQVTQVCTGEEVCAELNHLLTQALEAEATRWESVAHHAQQQLEALIHPLTERTADEWAGIFNGAALEILRDVRQRPDSGSTEEIDTILRQTAEGLSQLGQQMQSSVIPLARRGGSGRSELNDHIAQWLEALKRMKAAVKKRASDMTGRLPGGFSHRGILIRAISDWAAERRSEYVRDFPLQEKAEAATLFDRTLLEVIKDNRSQLAKRSDPHATGFISRLQLALQNAEEERRSTPAEILVGARSLPKEIQRWAEREVTSGAIAAVLREGCHLVVGPLSLPLRVLPGGAQSRGNPSCGLAGSDRVINTTLWNVAFRLTMSLSPTADERVAGTPRDKQQGERTTEIEKAILDVPQAEAWTAGFVGARGGFNAAVRSAIEQAVAREAAKFIAEATKQPARCAEADKHSPRRRAKRAAQSMVQEVKNEPGYKGATAALLSDIRSWDVRKAHDSKLSEAPREGGFYTESDSDLYIYLAGRFWPCKRLSTDLCGVFVTAWGMKKVVIISDINGHWDYADRTEVAKFNAFLDIQKNIVTSKLASATKTKINEYLTAERFISWEDLNKQIVTLLNDAFHELYLHPGNESLISIMLLRKAILDTQGVASDIFNGRAYERTNLYWDQRLLSHYWEAFNIDITDVTILAAARYARILADDAQAKYNKLNKEFFAKEKKRLADINTTIAQLKNKIWEGQHNPREYLSTSLAMAYYVRYSPDYTIELMKKEGEKNVVQSIIKRIQKKTDAYIQLIQSYKVKYQEYEEGMAFGDKTFAQRLRLQKDKSDIATAAKEAVAWLALQEVKLRQNPGFGNRESDRKQIDTLRIARASVRSLLVQQQTYTDLTQGLATINIEIPVAEKTYADIVWANKMSEAIYPKLYAEEENAAARDLLPAMLHWLQKNKKDSSHLKDQSVQEIIDTYAKSRHELNLLTIEKDIPEGYASLSEMLGREYFSSKWDYNQQFTHYKRKYSSYEASERVRELLIVSGLSLNEITEIVKKRIRLDVRKKNNVKNVYAGELLFIQLQNNNWIFFSIFPNATFHRRFTDAQMQSNPWLKTIASLEPQKVHSHGLESVFTEDFFKKQFGYANEKIYWDGTRRAAKEKEGLINNTLYKKEDDTQYPNPFEYAHFGGTEYDFYKHQEQAKKSLAVTLNISMKDALNRSANKLKSDLYKPSALHRIASLFIPFYSDIYGSLTDEEYYTDGFALMADIFAVVCVAAQVGTKIGALLKNAKGITTMAREGLARGLTGKGLYTYMIREMGKQGVINSIELGKISVNAIFDLVDALMLRDLSRYVLSKVRASMTFHNIVPGTSPAETVGKEFIRVDVVLKDMQKKILRGGEVYVGISPKNRSRIYYIETARGISEVRWSRATKAWRTVDPSNPKNPGQIMHSEKDKWVVASQAKGTAVQPEMGIQTLRNDLPDQKIAFNTQHATETEGVDAQALLEEFHNLHATKPAMTNPTERGKYAMAPVANFMLEKGFENIRYRGMAVFVNAMDKMPASHFVVIGAKNNRDYVFDLTAGELSRKYDELNGPVILPEELWAQKYANVDGVSLIKYGDYRSRVKADKIFGEHSEYTGHGPQAIIPNAKVLRRPEWYYPGSSAADSVTDSSSDIISTMAPTLAAGNRVMSSVRRSQLKTVTTDNATDYAVDVLENGELLNKETAYLLRQSIKNMTEEGKAISDVSDIFETPRLITSQEELLYVEKGELVLFFKRNAAVKPASTQPFHVMVSVGNGRFAGINNSALDEALTDGPRILLAEQLGDFTGTQVKRHADGEKVQIFAARPTGLLLAEKPPLRELANALPADTDSISGLTDLLAESGKLSPEQAQGLMRALQPVIENPAPVYGQLGTIEDLLAAPVRIKTEAEMMAVPEGQLVTFMRMGKSNAGHVMYSLGEGEFVLVNPARLDASLADKSTIIHARDLPSDLFRHNLISAGEISLKKMRVSALLGPEGAFSVEGSTLSIKAMGGPGAVNSMDAQELADTIRGLARSEDFAINLSSISEINLYSHFGAFGRLPVGKALAYLMNKKVTAYPAFYSPKLQDKEALLSEAKTFLPEDLSADELALLTKQQSRGHEFWQHTRSLFGDKGAMESVEMSSELKELLLKVADYIRGKVSIDDFLDGMPHFTNGLMIMKVGLNLLYNHEETDFDGFVSLSCDVLGASRFGIELMIHFLEK